MVLEAAAALYDSRFVRTTLFFLGILIFAGGFYLNVIPAVAFGFLVLVAGLYFAAYTIPRHEKELQSARVALAVSLERLGQIGDRRSYS